MEYLPHMRSFLLQPYPFSENVGRKLMFCFGIGLFIALFLAVFQPYHFDELPVAVKWGHAFLFGIVTFIFSSFLQALVPLLFPSVFLEKNWRSWKEILFLLITTLFIGAGNYWLMLYLYPQNSGWAGLLKAELITIQVGIFPIAFVVFMKQLTMYRRFAAEAKKVTKEIREEGASTAETIAPVLIHLRGDNQREALSIYPGNLFYVSSADNYVRIQYRDDGVQKSVLMRSTLKKMEDQLSAHRFFFRCHRMYLVNLQLVTSVTGNAQGLKLQLNGLDEAIPVSRNLTETVKEKLHQLSHSPHTA